MKDERLNIRYRLMRPSVSSFIFHLSSLVLVAGCATAVPVTHTAAPDKLGPTGAQRTARVFILISAPKPVDPDAGASGLVDTLKSLVTEKDREIVRPLTPIERDALGQAIAKRFAEAGSAAAYETVYDGKDPPSMASFNPTASLWIDPSDLSVRQESFNVKESSTVTKEKFRVKGRYRIAWRLQSEPEDGLLAQGQTPGGDGDFQSESGYKSEDLEPALHQQAAARQNELLAQIGRDLLPHKVERTRYISRGKGKFREAFRRLQSRDWDGAAQVWRDIIGQDSQDKTAHHDLGVYYERQGKWDDAKREYGQSGPEGQQPLNELNAIAQPTAVAPSTVPFLNESMAVLPFDNQTVDVEAPAYMRKKVEESLRAWGYPIQARDDTDERLRRIGVTEGGQLASSTMPQIAQAAGTQRLLWGTVEEYRTVNVGVYIRKQVKLSLKMTDAQGNVLWENRAQTVKQDVAKPKEAVASFLGNLAASQIEKMTHTYLREEADLTVFKACEPLPRYFAPITQ